MELNQDLIEEGKALVVKCESAERMTAESRFELGRWAEKCAPAQEKNCGSVASPTGGVRIAPNTALEEYADEVGVSFATLKGYRDIANAWGDDDPTGLSWTVARKLAYRTDRMSLISAVFEAYGKVTPKTIDDYEAHLRAENARREAILQPQFTDVTEDEEFWVEDEVENDTDFIYDPVNPPINTQPRKHGFSGPIRKLFSVVEHVRAAKALIIEESIPSVDYANDEHFEEILGACDTIVTEIMDYREMVVAKRVKAGLSPEVAS